MADRPSSGIGRRPLRWARLTLLALALPACGSRALVTPDGGPDDHVIGWGDPPNRKIDLLFMIDNSSETEFAQQNLVDGLPAFMDVLKGLPDGLPDLHIAVVTSDLGAGDGSITGCSGNGQNGVFQFAARSALGRSCTDTTLQAGATYIQDSGGFDPQTNFTAPDITTVLQCITPVGGIGCGFEHQLAAVARALGADGQPAPQENQGFLRPEALLAIVLLTNEDDCSAPVNSVLFDTKLNTTLASQVGPPGNYRCNEFGHLCGNPLQKPPRLSPDPADLTTEVALEGCVSAEDQGMLTPVFTFVQQIEGLKADPATQIQVLSIQGPATPYVVHWRSPPMMDTGPWPALEHSCATGVAFADPGVRLQKFVRELGDGTGLASSICDADFSAPLGAFATKLGALVTAPSGG